jgi:prevent-host-death family protein
MAMSEQNSVGVRELKENPGKYLRRVREEGVTYDVTIRGEVVARLVPPPQEVDEKTIEEIIAEHDALVERLSGLWTGTFNAADVMNEERRDL